MPMVLTQATAQISCRLFSHLPLCRRRSFHSSATLLKWASGVEPSNLTMPELTSRVCRLLVLERHSDLKNLSFQFSHELVDAVLQKLKLNPSACLQFFKLASNQPNYRPHFKAY